MPSGDPIADLNLKINEVIARLEQDGLSQAERDSLAKALHGYEAAREDLIVGELEGAAQKVKAADEELANAKAPQAALSARIAVGSGTGASANGASSVGDGTFRTRADLSSVTSPAQKTKRPLSASALQSACQQLGVSAAKIWAVVFTECDFPYSGYFPDGRPQILYERHIFHRLTGGRFSAAYPDISNSIPGGYGPSGSHQYDRLRKAMALDESAALQSASWGMGQTLGTNFKTLGYGSPRELVDQMFLSEDYQLSAMVAEIRTSKIAEALASQDWPNFARVYNGPSYAMHNYDGHLRSWYSKFSSGALPDLRVRAAQMYLMFCKLDPDGVDGIWGKRTLSALNQFQAIKGLPRTEFLDDTTFAALVIAGEAAAARTI